MDLDIALESKVGPAAFRELGLLAEQYGFRTIWAQNYARAPDAFMTAVPLALASKTIGVGVAVVCPHEMHPLKIANAVLTLNEHAGGRARIVVTSGGEWPGILKAKSGQLTRTREALEIINAAMGDKVVNYSGEIYNVQAFSTAWTSQSPPTIYAGAHRPKMMRMMTGQTNAIMLSDIQPPMFNWALAELKETLAQSSPEDNFRLSNFVSWHVKEDREASLWEARRELIIRGWLDRDWIAPYLSPEDAEWVAANPWPFLKAFRERTGDIKDVPSHISDALVEGLTLSGDPGDIDRHIERLREFKTAGFTEIVLGLQDDPAESIKLIGEQILPKLRNG
jgi:alkanesulfonate monooxygenase SsuD/methylene tetrahydromethanopterin reductase-like flavin-dependent oxidoreductase (luciferase family)